MVNFFEIAKKLGETDNQTQILFKANEVCSKFKIDSEDDDDSTTEMPEVITDGPIANENPPPQTGSGDTIINPTPQSFGCIPKFLHFFFNPTI